MDAAPQICPPLHHSAPSVSYKHAHPPPLTRAPVLCSSAATLSPPTQFDQEAIEAFAKFKEELKKNESSSGATPASSALSSALAVSDTQQRRHTPACPCACACADRGHMLSSGLPGLRRTGQLCVCFGLIQSMWGKPRRKSLRLVVLLFGCCQRPTGSPDSRPHPGCCAVWPVWCLRVGVQASSGKADATGEGGEDGAAGGEGEGGAKASGEASAKPTLSKLSKLNPNAKPFTLNINAKPFVPPTGTSSAASSVAGFAAGGGASGGAAAGGSNGSGYHAQAGGYAVEHQHQQQQHYSGGGMLPHNTAAYTHMLATQGHMYALQPGMVPPPGLAQGAPQHVAAVQGMQQSVAAAAGPPPGLGGPAGGRMGQPPPPAVAGKGGKRLFFDNSRQMAARVHVRG